MARFELVVNGVPYDVETDGERGLLYVLREDLELTGTKYGCGEAQCGACTVLVGGEAKRSCVLPVREAEGRAITTIEGLERDGTLHPLQAAFLEEDALQCGYCTPGMIMSGVALLRERPAPTVEQIVDFMDGNVCRCGTYPRIIVAIQRAAETGGTG